MFDAQSLHLRSYLLEIHQGILGSLKAIDCSLEPIVKISPFLSILLDTFQYILSGLLNGSLHLIYSLPYLRLYLKHEKLHIETVFFGTLCISPHLH